MSQPNLLKPKANDIQTSPMTLAMTLNVIIQSEQGLSTMTLPPFQLHYIVAYPPSLRWLKRQCVVAMTSSGAALALGRSIRCWLSVAPMVGV